MLLTKIGQLELQVAGDEAQRTQMKEQYAAKNKELRAKLDKAFVQLTANDNAARDLQELREQIKDMQTKMTEPIKY